MKSVPSFFSTIYNKFYLFKITLYNKKVEDLYYNYHIKKQHILTNKLTNKIFDNWIREYSDLIVGGSLSWLKLSLSLSLYIYQKLKIKTQRKKAHSNLIVEGSLSRHCTGVIKSFWSFFALQHPTELSSFRFSQPCNN